MWGREGTPVVQDEENNDHDETLTTRVTTNILTVEDIDDSATPDERVFDIVPSKAVKGAVVSSIRNPISSSPVD